MSEPMPFREMMDAISRPAVVNREPGLASPSDLEHCCVQLLKGKFWCDAGHDLQAIFEILEAKNLMACNEHGRMVEVTPSEEHPAITAAKLLNKGLDAMLMTDLSLSAALSET